METSLPLPLLVELDEAEDGLSRPEISCLGTIFLEVASNGYEKVLQLLKHDLSQLQLYLDGSRLKSPDEAVALLDAGARKIFVKPEQLPELSEYASRVAPVVCGSVIEALPSATDQGLLITDFDLTNSDDASTFAVQKNANKISSLFIRPVEGSDLTRFVEFAAKAGAIPVIPSARLTCQREEAGKLSVAKLLSRSWSSDRPDGLVPTVVCDEAGVALGLVYSSEESVLEALRTQTGVYQSRKRGLWYKGATSGDTQQLVRIELDCDSDALKFTVRQTGRFCHLPQSGCFGNLKGIPKLEQMLLSRYQSAPAGSYTARLFADEKLLRAKIMEEAEELCDAKTREAVAFEAADLLYFALAKAIAAGVTLREIESSLDAKSWKVTRRAGQAKGKWAEKEGINTDANGTAASVTTEAAKDRGSGTISMKRYDVAQKGRAELATVLKRPSQKSSDAIMKTVVPIVDDVRTNGDKAVLKYTHEFEKATSLTCAVLKAPFPESLMQLSPETIKAIDTSYENIRKFHAAQKEEKPLQVETMPGVTCSRFSRPIEAVGLYIPGGTAVLPSTALMLGVPAMVAGCKKIVLATPPRPDGSVTPEIVYVAHKVGAESIVLAGGAQAVAAMAYGTESVSKVDKILGPGNQFVTAAKMLVSNGTDAGVAIDMPAGPSELLVIADRDANPAFLASDLLSQAEHGVDSQVVLIAVDLTEHHLQAIETELHRQAMALPRVDIVRGAIAHSTTVLVKSVEQAMDISNEYAPEHLILQLKEAEKAVDMVVNAGSVFVGEWTPESVGDYSAGVNHSLPTYGYAKQYSGVNLGSFVKHITSSSLTFDGLRNVGEAVMQLARVEELEAHRRAVAIRLAQMGRRS